MNFTKHDYQFETDTLKYAYEIAVKRFDSIHTSLNKLTDWSKYYIAVLGFEGYIFLYSIDFLANFFRNNPFGCMVVYLIVLVLFIIFCGLFAFSLFWFFKALRPFDIGPFPDLNSAWDSHFNTLEKRGYENDLSFKLFLVRATNNLRRINRSRANILKDRYKAHRNFRDFSMVILVFSFTIVFITKIFN